MIFPVLIDLDENYYLQMVHSLLPYFIKYKGRPESLWVDIADAHPNEKAHAIAADSLYDYLTPLLKNKE